MVEENISLIEQANLAALRLEQANLVALEANKTKELLLKKEETLQNNRLLGGHSSAGTATPLELTPEERIRTENKAMFKNTIMDGVFK